MPVTTDFDVFAQRYHENNGTTYTPEKTVEQTIELLVANPAHENERSFIKKRLSGDLLISDILRFLKEHGSMRQDEYDQLIKDRIRRECMSGTKSKWKSGNRGVIYTMTNTESEGGHPWLSKQQAIFGSIVIVSKDKQTISLTDTWRLLLDAC